MTYIETVAEGHATGAVAAMYETDRGVFGRLPNLTQAFSRRPELYAVWRELNGGIKTRMGLHRYELATFAAARTLGSAYCSLAHGRVLADDLIGADAVKAILADHRAAGLEEVDVAVMDVAAKVAEDAETVGPADIERLRSLGLDDGEITDVVAAAAARAFFSKMLAGLGAAPDASFDSMDPELREALRG
jgi:uncharacterized peroxidase-related enzyme